LIKLDIHDARVIPDSLTLDAIREMRKYNWKPSYCITGRRCYLSGNSIPWFTQAYKGTRRITGPGTDVVIIKWATPDAFLMAKLKGTIK